MRCSDGSDSIRGLLQNDRGVKNNALRKSLARNGWLQVSTHLEKNVAVCGEVERLYGRARADNNNVVRRGRNSSSGQGGYRSIEVELPHAGTVVNEDAPAGRGAGERGRARLRGKSNNCSRADRIVEVKRERWYHLNLQAFAPITSRQPLHHSRLIDDTVFDFVLRLFTRENEFRFPF